jgi:tetratricopeptide (TPR) repeat protein
MPTTVSAHSMLALALLNDKQVLAAFDAAAEALRRQPDYAFGHYAMAYVLLRYPTRQKRRRSFRLANGNSVLEEQRKRIIAAKKSVKRALEIIPSHPDFLELLSTLEGSLNRWQASLEAAELGLAANPNHIACANRRAIALNQLGRSDQARAEIDRALTLNPEHAPTHANRGWVLLQAGDYVRAQQHFLESLRVNPMNRSAKIGLFNARGCWFPPHRWLVRFALWSRLAAVRPFLITGMVVAGITIGALRDRDYPWLLVLPAVFLECIATTLVLFAFASGVQRIWRSLRAAMPHASGPASLSEPMVSQALETDQP